jgi:hypothetical protein
MNDNKELFPGSMVVGGLILLCFFVDLLFKAIASAAREAEIMFAAIGKAGAGFLVMAWNLAQLTGLISLGVLAIYAAYRYIKFVKEACEIEQRLLAKYESDRTNLERLHGKLEERVTLSVNGLRQVLEDALAKPEIAPEVAPSSAAETPLEQPSDEIKNESNETDTTPTVSNPY